MSELKNFKQVLIGCFGDPIWENPTETMMEAAFQHHQMKFRYISSLVKKQDLKAAFEGVKAMGYKGFNCTLPHKVAIIPLLDGLGESARLMQAVNCVVERDGLYIGENTDGKGFLESLKEVMDPLGKRVVIFGAGGAARAVSIELALAGVLHITIVNRSQERGNELLKLIHQHTQIEAELLKLEEGFSIPAYTDILINCTNVGLFPDTEEKLPLNYQSLESSTVVCDLIPNPPMTAFLQEAANKGCTTLDGLGMLVNQGAIGIKYWSGIEVDREVMRKSLIDLFH